MTGPAPKKRAELADLIEKVETNQAMFCRVVEEFNARMRKDFNSTVRPQYEVLRELFLRARQLAVRLGAEVSVFREGQPEAWKVSDEGRAYGDLAYELAVFEEVDFPDCERPEPLDETLGEHEVGEMCELPLGIQDL